jgi:hypothetical protein
MDLEEVGGGRGDWMELAQDRDGWTGTCEYGKELSVQRLVSFSRRTLLHGVSE